MTKITRYDELFQGADVILTRKAEENLLTMADRTPGDVYKIEGIYFDNLVKAYRYRLSGLWFDIEELIPVTKETHPEVYL